MQNDHKSLFKTAAAGLCLTVALGGCGHVSVPFTRVSIPFTHEPPGTSVAVAQAKRALPVPTPKPAPVASVATELPSRSDTQTENIADFYTLGNLMMQQEKYDEAIKAYESAVKLDPTFSDAWDHLAICYQNTGQSKKAVEAFKKSKTIARYQ